MIDTILWCGLIYFTIGSVVAGSAAFITVDTKASIEKGLFWPIYLAGYLYKAFLFACKDAF